MDKMIWLGMDVHARSIVIARMERDSAKPTILEIPNDLKRVRRTLSKLAKEGTLHCCYEAGPCGFELYRLLTSMNIRCDVVAPSLIPQKPGERVKTDRRDAEKLARLLRAGELQPIYVPDEEQEAVRDLLRAREQTRRDRTKARQRLSKFLLRHGRHWTSGVGWTEKHKRWIKQQTFERRAERVTFDHYLEQVQHLDERIRELEVEIGGFAESPTYRVRVERLSCLRGISTLSAMVLLSELHDLRRFHHPRELMAYVGLVPSEHSSGGSVRRGAITKAGNAHVRRILVEASWSYRRGRTTVTRAQQRQLASQPPDVAQIARRATHRLGRRYGRLVSRGKKSQVAITAVAREMCGFIWALETQVADAA